MHLHIHIHIRVNPPKYTCIYISTHTQTHFGTPCILFSRNKEIKRTRAYLVSHTSATFLVAIFFWWHSAFHSGEVKRIKAHLVSHIHVFSLTHIRIRIDAYISTHTHTYTCMYDSRHPVGWLRLVGSLELQVSFIECHLFYRALLKKRPIISRSLLMVATPYILRKSTESRLIHSHTHTHTHIRIHTHTHTHTQMRV